MGCCWCQCNDDGPLSVALEYKATTRGAEACLGMRLVLICFVLCRVGDGGDAAGTRASRDCTPPRTTPSTSRLRRWGHFSRRSMRLQPVTRIGSCCYEKAAAEHLACFVRA